MISRKNRFHGHHSVSRVRGQVLHTDFFSIRYAKNSKNEDYRLAVVVSKKIDKRAVVRNKIRRRIYEIFRKQNQLKGRNLDVVIYVKTPDVAIMPHAKLEELIKTTTSKLLFKTTN